jgi:protein O-mannosyl-transferase
MPRARTGFLNKPFFAYGLLILLPVIVFYKSLFNDFCSMDEEWLILKDTGFLSKWENIFAAFNDTVIQIYYRPLMAITLILDYQAGGINPLGYHITNLFFHLLSVICFYRLLLLFGNEKRAALFFSLIFSVHPVIVHAVAWVPGRNDSMLCLFTLLSVIQLIRYLQNPAYPRLFFHFLFFACALFTKENAVVLPLIYISVFFVYNAFSRKLFVLCAVWFCMIAGWYLLKSSVVNYYAETGNDGLLILKKFLLGLLINIGKSVLPFQQLVAPTIRNSSAIPGLLVLIGFVILYLKFGVKNKKIAFTGLLIYISLLLIPLWFSSGVILREHYEHRLYTCLAGLILFTSQLRIDFSGTRAAGIFMILISVFSVKTFIRTETYKNGITFLSEAIDHWPENYFFYFQRGNQLYNLKRFEAAVEDYTEALKRQPGKAQILVNRGNAYVELGRKQQAIADFDEVLKSGFNDQALLAKYGAHRRFGEIGNAIRDMQLLKQYYNQEIPPLTNEELHQWNLERLLELNKLMLKEPAKGILYVNRAKVYVDLRMGKEALADLKKACELEPDNKEFREYYETLNKTFPH